MANDDFSTMAQAAMGRTLTLGYGMVLSEVHDCQDIRLRHAVADVNVSRFVTTYFTESELDPLPDLQARNTTALGLYAVLDITPGVVTVGAAGVNAGALLSLGHLRVRVHPDAVTWVPFSGPQPFVVMP